MFFVDTIEVAGLGNRSYLAGGERTAVAVDPPRDIDRVIAAAARHGVRITHVVETHVHNDYVSGGLELARITGARYLVPAGARVSFARTPVHDGDRTEIDAMGALALRAVATPGHTPHHTSYVLEENGVAVAVFTGGALLIGTVGRPDLVEPRLTESLARAQHASAHRLAAELPDETSVLPTHGFGSFCSSAQAEGDDTTIGREKASNAALTRDVDTFVAELLAGLEDVPAYYAHMAPANAHGPAPVDLSPPAVADAEEIAARLAAGEWVVDLRSRVAFAEGHVAGSLNFEAAGQLATYLAWLIPWGRPLTLLAESAEQLHLAQRELVQVGIDRPAAAAVGEPADWVRASMAPVTFPRATFADLAERRRHGRVVVLDVRRDSERAGGYIDGSLHIPIHELHGRLGEVPDGQVWVHCAGGMRAAIAASLLDAAGRDVVAVDDTFAAAEQARLTATRREAGRVGAQRAARRTGHLVGPPAEGDPVPPEAVGAVPPGDGDDVPPGDGDDVPPGDGADVPPGGAADVQPDDRDAVPADHDDAVLLDIRESYEWHMGHAPGAVHAPFSALEAGAALPERVAGRALVVVCRSGNRSRQAAELLVARGADAVDVIGGMRAWARLGLPVVDARGESGTVA